MSNPIALTGSGFVPQRHSLFDTAFRLSELPRLHDLAALQLADTPIDELYRLAAENEAMMAAAPLVWLPGESGERDWRKGVTVTLICEEWAHGWPAFTCLDNGDPAQERDAITGLISWAAEINPPGRPWPQLKCIDTVRLQRWQFKSFPLYTAFDAELDCSPADLGYARARANLQRQLSKGIAEELMSGYWTGNPTIPATAINVAASALHPVDALAALTREKERRGACTRSTVIWPQWGLPALARYHQINLGESVPMIPTGDLLGIDKGFDFGTSDGNIYGDPYLIPDQTTSYDPQTCQMVTAPQTITAPELTPDQAPIWCTSPILYDWSEPQLLGGPGAGQINAGGNRAETIVESRVIGVFNPCHTLAATAQIIGSC